MVNWLHSRFYDPARGWDPVPAQHAQEYSRATGLDLQLVDRFAAAVGGLQGKRVADVGSGPGQYSLEFARRGAQVTCVDISRNYLSMIAERMRQEGLSAHYALGYMDDINRTTAGNFDALFSNVAWNYCMNDWSFARQLLRATRPGGVIVIRETNQAYVPRTTLYSKAVYWLNQNVGWKIGHPRPPRGRIEAAFRRAGPCEVTVDYGDPLVDIVTVRRADR
ncbi:MAG TPA: class I SAM-dependent methyltransferase [Steroidobacteraceae bacterium]|nr:class I SAM-dependent methyltransferase [Steroidobacteraceae bacterium]